MDAFAHKTCKMTRFNARVNIQLPIPMIPENRHCLFIRVYTWYTCAEKSCKSRPLGHNATNNIPRTIKQRLLVWVRCIWKGANRMVGNAICRQVALGIVACPVSGTGFINRFIIIINTLAKIAENVICAIGALFTCVTRARADFRCTIHICSSMESWLTDWSFWCKIFSGVLIPINRHWSVRG